MMIFWTIMSAWPLNIRSSGKPLLSSTQICSRSIFSFGSFGLRWRFFLPLASPTPSPLASACLRSVSDDISPSFFLLALISGFPCSPFSRLFSSLRFWTSIFRASFSEANRSTIFSSFLTQRSALGHFPIERFLGQWRWFQPVSLGYSKCGEGSMF